MYWLALWRCNICAHTYIYIYLFIYKFIYAVLNKATSWQMMASWIPRLLGPVPAFHGHHHTAGLADQAPEMGATRRQSRVNSCGHWMILPRWDVYAAMRSNPSWCLLFPQPCLAHFELFQHLHRRAELQGPLWRGPWKIETCWAAPCALLYARKCHVCIYIYIINK